ncbi:hypothetical protein GGI15_003887 [Coemansia interrupta]|uniref:Large ribosomal subunit protein mL53 n=1 Tax=Coemansia interrupta TaxID=1126814 RepID=A0A9W8H626_9FUNG|nr:hypothetical protein GGI15_003887 [Coemansia interrupta]
MLKQISSVRVSFSPFSPTSTSSTVFLNRVFSKKNQAANPSCKVTVETTAFSKDPSVIDVTFKDGHKLHINAADLTGDHIIAQVSKYSKRLSQQEDLQGQ